MFSDYAVMIPFSCLWSSNCIRKSSMHNHASRMGMWSSRLGWLNCTILSWRNGECFQDVISCDVSSISIMECVLYWLSEETHSLRTLHKRYTQDQYHELVIGHDDFADTPPLDLEKVDTVIRGACKTADIHFEQLVADLSALSPHRLNQFERSCLGSFGTTALERHLVRRGLSAAQPRLVAGLNEVYTRSATAFETHIGRLFRITRLTRTDKQVHLVRPSKTQHRVANAVGIITFLSSQGAGGLTEIATRFQRVLQPDWTTSITVAELECVQNELDACLASIGEVSIDMVRVEGRDGRDIINYFLPELMAETGSIMKSVFTRSLREELVKPGVEWNDATREALTSTYELVGEILLQTLRVDQGTVEDLQLQARDFAPEVARMRDAPGFTLVETVNVEQICEALDTILQIQNLPQLGATLSSLDVVDPNVSWEWGLQSLYSPQLSYRHLHFFLRGVYL
jgi:hypothetical protein